MTESEGIGILHHSDPRRTSLHHRVMATRRCLVIRLRRVLITLSLFPVMTSCYVHRAHDPRHTATPIPYQGEVRVLTVSGEVFMLRSAAIHGDTLSGDRIFCTAGWGYDEDWCKGVRRFPADSARIAIPVGDIREALTRSFSAGRTTLVAAGLAAGIAVVILLIIGISQVPPAY